MNRWEYTNVYILNKYVCIQLCKISRVIALIISTQIFGMQHISIFTDSMD